MFNVIYADPCWAYSNKRTGGSMKSGACQKYQTMSLDEICKLDISKIIQPDSILFLWITNPLIFSHTPKVLETWGFQYRTLLTWKKPMGLGFWLRGCTEHLVVATKGNIKPFRFQKENFFQSKKRLGHSQKPQEIRQMIDEISNKTFGPQAKKLEMFATSQASGWESWGLSIDGNTIKQKIDEFCLQNQQTNIIKSDEVNDVR